MNNETVYSGSGGENILRLIGFLVLALIVGLTIVGKWGGPHDHAREEEAAAPSPVATALAAALRELETETETPAARPGSDETDPGDSSTGPASGGQDDRTGDRPTPPAVTADFLRTDPRTAWAYRRYLGQRSPAGIPEATGRRLLAAVEHGDHVELFLDATARESANLLDAVDWSRRGADQFVAARTLRGWILVERDDGVPIVLPGPAWSGLRAGTSRSAPASDVGWATVLSTPDGRSYALKVFLDDRDGGDLKIIEHGAGEVILRLPEAQAVPPMPDVTDLPADLSAQPPAVLPADWQTAEEIACTHMRGLGFLDAETTRGGRDGGLDVQSERGVAQVKMLAQPVGAPPVQQLRGTRPNAAYHLFYSTSGYTSAAIAAAAEIGVALFRIAPTGQVGAVNAPATRLARHGAAVDGDQQGAARRRSVERLVDEYAAEVVARVTRAVENTDRKRAVEHARYPGQEDRLNRYLFRALDNLTAERSFPSARSALAHYHHSELLAHVWFQELGIPYPDGGGRSEPETLESYYG
ncbi:restriction endonuclease [Micromonospora siamensis]|uniref:restriction endonuclease n=1 Tax=Micromonospora siamensis TaxID=299152 RepID=UPI001560366F|nr:restriction endonuclease [Micromonospora siamensis]